MTEGSPITGIVLTFNEASNIERALQGLAGVCRDVLVVDSGSTDGTVEIARRHGARIVSHPFTSHAAQWSFALQQPGLGTWVIALDADQAPDLELGADLLRIAKEAGDDVTGVYVNRLTVFRGRPMRHGGLFPKWMLKMFRPQAVEVDGADLFDLRFGVRGRTVQAGGVLTEDNQNEGRIEFWVAKHNRYAEMLAREELRRLGSSSAYVDPPRLFGTPDQRLLYFKAIWDRLPRYWRAVAYFLYRYILRRGFLDGKEGFQFHFLQALWFRVLVDIQMDSLEQAGRPRPPGVPGPNGAR
ncbi:MAG: glycosyltransferase family 2 protein [Anaeromyxobacter sp.]|nr:glycosyltransferase family 2 protein [Anaeromyxobacter sp.]